MQNDDDCFYGTVRYTLFMAKRKQGVVEKVRVFSIEIHHTGRPFKQIFVTICRKYNAFLISQKPITLPSGQQNERNNDTTYFEQSDTAGRNPDSFFGMYLPFKTGSEPRCHIPPAGKSGVFDL